MDALNDLAKSYGMDFKQVVVGTTYMSDGAGGYKAVEDVSHTVIETNFLD
jgi:hypothetical protein